MDARADGLRFERRWRGDLRGVRVHAEGWTANPDGTLTADVVVPGRSEWSGCLQVRPSWDGVELPSRYRCDEPVERTVPSQRLREWRLANPVVHTDHRGLTALIERTEEDLGALRIFDPEHPDRVAVAAGAPWFMTVFGRDSLLTAWMALLVDPGLAMGTLRTLARFQGTQVEPRSDQEPGKILHEMRFGSDSAHSLAGGTVYYGSIDASPLFVMLLGEAALWGADRDAVAELLPAADRALAWIETYGDRDGDGYVEYERATDRELRNQGWKDSFDGVTFADGRIADTPIALAEVQGYTYAAYIARAHVARQAGDDATAERWAERADALRTAFNRDFWLPDQGWFALGLDRDQQAIDSLASDMGHCLWTGIIDEAKAAVVAEHLLSPEMFTGWGVRTDHPGLGGGDLRADARRRPAGLGHRREPGGPGGGGTGGHQTHAVDAAVLLERPRRAALPGGVLRHLPRGVAARRPDGDHRAGQRRRLRPIGFHAQPARRAARQRRHLRRRRQAAPGRRLPGGRRRAPGRRLLAGALRRPG
jgi:hypothetical protein